MKLWPPDARLQMTRSDLLQRRDHAGAVWDGDRAACSEDAAGGWIDRAWDVTLEEDTLAPDRWIGDRHTREQRLGIRMHRVPVELLGWGDLHNFPEIHDDDAVAEILNYAKVVSDEQEGEPKLILQVLQQVDDLCLDGDIEG